MLILIIAFVCIGGGWFVGKSIGNIIFPKETAYKTPPTIINHYKTENHLHISKEDLQELILNKTTSKVN